MRAICVDDEAILLKVLEKAVGQSPDIQSVASFSNGKSAIAYAKENPIDIAFLDIQIHQMNGIELAVELRKIYPKLFVVFCTGYGQYALDAFKVHANGYLTKPIYAADVQEQIDAIKSMVGEPVDELYMQCFGNFEVFYKGKPIDFKRSKSKELLAFLVDRRGAVVTVGQISAALYEDELDEKRIKNNIYQAYHTLRAVLDEIGYGDLLIKNTRSYAVDVTMFACDYYRYLSGEVSLQGEEGYMLQYSWAEETNGRLFAADVY